MKSTDALYATSNGVPMPHPYETQRVGENGPLLLQDFHLIDLLSHFDRERIPELTQLDLFGAKGKKCPVTVRSSTVGGESGSHDLARDPRGFAFPHFIHTQKRDPSTHLRSGNDSTMFWDYLCNNPESVHQVMVLLGDRGIPDGWRFMHGYSGHTLKLVNKAGDWVYCQIHMKSMQGEFTLNENAINYFAEIEQAAFNPAHMPPGIEPSADPVLQSRLFSYPDTHWHRIGVNYQQLPVNAPRTGFRFANFQRDGSMAFYNQGARPSYLSSINPIQFRARTIRPEDFNGPRALWQKVWDEPARQRFISNVAGKMAVCREKHFLKRQIAVFREVDPDIAARLEKATGVKGYDGIAGLRFNGTHNGMTIDPKLRYANSVSVAKGSSCTTNNSAPSKGTTHKHIESSANGA
ncbi:catalase-like domain-containing protein [Bombardia bombarda]|uniref:Catalase-like domain-containing protein n=1 Tax=Bombardia bombarda TaxID=252184 RepID=A0AA39XA77_9PEZI|nr:catalase-like domain-containing protein [Bombardia bombarda]